MSKNCISYYLPKLQAAGLPVPNTELVTATCKLGHLLDGTKPEGFDAFLAALAAAASRVGPPGGPVFLRTGQTSGKHEWKDTCFVADTANMASHVAALVHFSACAGFVGLPFDLWAVREMLPVEPVAVLPAYGDMPLVREFRYFVGGGKVLCRHPYWPAVAICQGYKTEPRSIARVIESSRRVSLAHVGLADALAARVAEVFADDEPMSADLLLTREGWFVTDMALAEDSWHWPGCPNEKEK